MPAGTLIGGLALISACTPASINNLFDGDLDTGGLSCGLDSSNDAASAYAGSFDADLEDSLCPVTDVDYWRLVTDAANQILDVEVTYVAVSNIDLTAALEGPAGICINDPAQVCGLSGGCDATDICDLGRGLCRPNHAAPCALAQGCETGTLCDTASEEIDIVYEDSSGGALHRVTNSRPGGEPGEYFLRVYSVDLGFQADPENLYTLRVAHFTDPDTNEPNNAVNMATDLPAGAIGEGYIAYRGDVDWYRVAHAVTSPPVVETELTWSVAAEVNPTWEICYPECTAPPAPDPVLVGSGPTAREVRRRRFLAPLNEAVFVKVSNLDAGTETEFDTTMSYELTVTITTDPAEGEFRNDEPDAATVVTLEPASTTPTTFTRVETLVSDDDRDWFRLDVPAGQTDHSLLWVSATAAAPEEAGFLLQLSLYRDCDYGSGDCGTANVTLANGATITSWYTFPSPDSRISAPGGVGSFQMGGASPNHLITQVPLSQVGQGAYYLVVNHIASTPMDLPGYSPAGLDCSTDSDQPGCYVLRIEHRREPDDVDRTDPDNEFIARPSRLASDGDPFYEHDDFFAHYRDIPATAGADTQWLVTPRAGSAGFVVVGDTAFVEADTCGPVTLYSFDELGQSAPGTLEALTAGDGLFDGLFVDDCLEPTLPVTMPLAITGSGTAVNYAAPVTTGDVTVTATLQGEVGINSFLPVVAVGTGAPLRLSVVDSGGGAAPTGFVAGGTTGPLLVRLPAATSAPVVLQLALTSTNPSAVPAIACSSWGSSCPDLGDESIDPPIDPGDRCPSSIADGISTCQIAILEGSTYLILLDSTESGPVTLRISDRAGVELEGSYTTAAFTGARFEFYDFDETIGDPFFATGYISYVGDQDFFRIPLGTTFPEQIRMTIRLKSAASALDVRAQATRGSIQTGVGAVAPAGDDLCDDCGSSASCDDRGFCTRGAPLDVLVGASGTVSECVFVVPGGDVEIWVNDAYANDWDISDPYEISLMMEEGCPAVCPSAVCAQ